MWQCQSCGLRWRERHSLRITMMWFNLKLTHPMIQYIIVQLNHVVSIVVGAKAMSKGLILCLRSLLPHTSGWERWSQSFTEMRSIEVKDAMIIARGLMCEATMTKNTGLNSIISWVVDLNDRKSPFHSEYSCRSEHCIWSLVDLCLH